MTTKKTKTLLTIGLYSAAIAVAVAAASCNSLFGCRLPRPTGEPPVKHATKAADAAASVDTGAAAKRKIVSHPSELKFDSLDWKVPLGDHHRVQLASGPIAYVAVDSALPLVSIAAYIRSGSLTDPAGKEGLGSLMTRLMRIGGTERYNADTLDALIDQLAMSFSFSQGEADISFRASFLSEYLDTAMVIMKEMFFHPAFDSKKLERERNITLEGISNRFANPGPTLSVAYRKHAYQKSAPARISTASSVRSIKRNDIVALHKAAFSSCDIILAVSGKFNRDDMIARLNAVFSAPIKPQPQAIPDITVDPQTRALVVHKGISQAYIRMGLPLFQRPHQDYYAVMLLDYILGGSGFTSRLGARVRSDEGLTYSIHSNAESNYVYPATFHITFYTKTASFPKAVTIVLEELDKIVKTGVTEEELASAKASLITELPSSFRSPEDIVSTYAWNEFYGRAPDHYVKYPDELRKLTKADIDKAARKYIAVDKMTYTIVGDTTAINAAMTAAVKDGFFAIDSLKSKKVMAVDALERFE
ncbi:MAG: insulinase family protein [Chitinispirillales bacterium]|jgi:zinc protease|nr:insulinase family protein [Chitinispirillales bacterium]